MGGCQEGEGGWRLGGGHARSALAVIRSVERARVDKESGKHQQQKYVNDHSKDNNANRALASHFYMYDGRK